MKAVSLKQLTTPCCLIDKSKMLKNIARLASRIENLGCQIRPHVKTHKSIEVTKAIVAGGGVKGITVSTLKEAEHFFAHGFNDILYAVGMVPNKLERVAKLIENGCDLKIIIDNPEMLSLIVEKSQHYNCQFKLMLELDTDGHRAGLDPNSDALIEAARSIVQSRHLEFLGLMTHAGGSYDCFSQIEQQRMAKQERELTLLAANRLFEQGIKCDVLSIGSTPTAFNYEQLDGITEVRAGVYVFFDLVMAGLGVCEQDDIAISVLASVIGYQKDKQRVITDAGWMAMSRDRGTQHHKVDQGYGLVLDNQGKWLGDYLVLDANQEHGIIAPRNSTQEIDFNQFPLGSTVRILPNHACATAAQFDCFYLIENNEIVAQLPSLSGW